MDVNLRSLIGKFNPTTRNATEAAAGLCLSRAHYNVEIEHYLFKLLDTADGDFAAIAKHAEIDKARFATELTRALDRFKTGNGRTPNLSPDFVETMTQAWTIASIDFEASQIRTGFTVLALVSSDRLSRIIREISKESQKISPEDLRKSKGDVPPVLKTVTVRTLDLALLQAGAGVKGEFENRLKSLINEVKASPIPIILFIDEAHTMIGAGGQAGQNDAANLLKPALARGELRTIAATTWAEYKKYFEKDAALARRFQVVKVEEPDEAKAIAMMRGLAEALENHHRVRILAEAVEDAVRLSHRYISGRQLPDKSVSVLDTACARVAIGQGATPALVEDAQRRIDQLTTEMNALEREAITGLDHSERIAELKAWKTAEEVRLANLKAQWEKEREIIEQVRDIRGQLEQHATAQAAVVAGSENGKEPAVASAAAAGAATATAPGEGVPELAVAPVGTQASLPAGEHVGSVGTQVSLPAGEHAGSVRTQVSLPPGEHAGSVRTHATQPPI